MLKTMKLLASGRKRCSEVSPYNHIVTNCCTGNSVIDVFLF